MQGRDLPHIRQNFRTIDFVGMSIRRMPDIKADGTVWSLNNFCNKIERDCTTLGIFGF